MIYCHVGEGGWWRKAGSCHTWARLPTGLPASLLGADARLQAWGLPPSLASRESLRTSLCGHCFYFYGNLVTTNDQDFNLEQIFAVLTQILQVIQVIQLERVKY